MSEFTPGIQKVLDHVARTKGWQLTPANLRRRAPWSSYELCPLMSFTRSTGDYGRIAMKRTGLSREEVYRITDTADSMLNSSNYDPALRVALLQAARLA